MKEVATAAFFTSAKALVSSIFFPLISSGIYGYQKEHDLHVYIVVYDQKAFGLSKRLFTSITEYIDENYIEERDLKNYRSRRISNEVIVQESLTFLVEMPDRKRSAMGLIRQALEEKGLAFADFAKSNRQTLAGGPLLLFQLEKDDR